MLEEQRYGAHAPAHVRFWLAVQMAVIAHMLGAWPLSGACICARSLHET